MSDLKIASVLAFERRLDISDACFSQKDSNRPNEKNKPINVREKSVRGVISNQLNPSIANDPMKLDAEIQKANLQTVDTAMLIDDHDTLCVNWSCKVLPFTGIPCVCNKQPYQKKLVETVQAYIQNQGFKTLAKRYATNIANARWLWRNRVGSKNIKVTVYCEIDGKRETLVFERAHDMNLNDFDFSNEQLDTLTRWIELGLHDKQFIILNIEAEALIGRGQEVYPSQELILDTGNKKSKVLYRINDEAKTGMHSQKIGNAIRTIDTWYDKDEDAQFPIAVEPYGSVTTLGTAFRKPKQKTDFYTLLNNWVINNKVLDIEAQHYVMATLIRGGVFGQTEKKK